MFYLIDTVSRKRSNGRVLSGCCRANTGTCGSLPDVRPLLLNTIADCTTSIQTTRPHTADDSIEYPIPPTLFGLIIISFIPFLNIEKSNHFIPSVFRTTGAMAASDPASARPAARRPNRPRTPGVDQTARPVRIGRRMQQGHLATDRSVNTLDLRRLVMWRQFGASHERRRRLRRRHVFCIVGRVVRIVLERVMTLKKKFLFFK